MYVLCLFIWCYSEFDLCMVLLGVSRCKAIVRQLYSVKLRVAQQVYQLNK